MPATPQHFLKPSLIARWMNKTVGLLARIGIGPAYIRLLRVRGRSSGKIYSTPVNLLEFAGRQYLVSARGHTGWSKNAAVVGVVELARGRDIGRYRVRAVADADKPEILKAYLNQYSKTVQRFFSVPAGSSTEAFRAVAERHPVFELLPF
jgi:deazaflavin-dependent oxidoreductase (nitroreductase family)